MKHRLIRIIIGLPHVMAVLWILFRGLKILRKLFDMEFAPLFFLVLCAGFLLFFAALLHGVSARDAKKSSSIPAALISMIFMTAGYVAAWYVFVVGLAVEALRDWGNIG